MRRIVLAIVALAFVVVAPAFAQERMFSVSMPETQWNSLGKILTKVPWPSEETNPLLNSIAAQIGQNISQDNVQRQAAAKEVTDLKAEVERLKAELEKLKNPPQETPQ